MSFFEDKRYCIDPGKGKKMDGCPYSIYEDGHDVQDYIIPPKGYTFVGFKFDPNTGNQIYDGKLYAQYEKEPLKVRLKSNLWKVILAFAIVLVVVLITLLIVSIFKPSKSHEKPSGKQKTEIVSDTSVTTKDNTAIDSEPTTVTSDSNQSSNEETVVHNESQTVAEQPTVIEQNTQPAVQQNIEEALTPSDDPSILFKKEFWAMIHERNASMDAYTELYNQYKTTVKKGAEFDYLRFTILKNYVSYKAWYEQLKAIPDNTLSSIESIEELNKHIKG